MDAFGVLGNPARRHILELLASGEKSSGAITRTISEQRGISEAAVSQHLKAILDNGLVTVRPAGMNRFYAINTHALHPLKQWLSQFCQPPQTPAANTGAAPDSPPARHHRHTPLHRSAHIPTLQA